MTDRPPPAETAAETPRGGLSAPVWIGILTLAILALLVFVARNSFAA